MTYLCSIVFHHSKFFRIINFTARTDKILLVIKIVGEEVENMKTSVFIYQKLSTETKKLYFP